MVVRNNNRAVSYEQLIVNLLQKNKFMYEGKEFNVIKAEKPKPSKGGGEVKTDIYVLASHNEASKEFKISLKMSNAEFIENKITSERLKQFPHLAELFNSEFGDSLFGKFSDYKTLSSPITKGGYLEFNMGARLDLMTFAGKLYNDHPITNKSIIREAYLGENLTDYKKTAKFRNGSIVVNAGIPNFFLELDIKQELPDLQSIIDLLVPVDDYLITHEKLYPALRCVNLRVNVVKNIYKIENRSLILPVNYSHINDDDSLDSIVGVWDSFNGEYINSLERAKQDLLPRLETIMGTTLKRA